MKPPLSPLPHRSQGPKDKDYRSTVLTGQPGEVGQRSGMSRAGLFSPPSLPPPLPSLTALLAAGFFERGRTDAETAEPLPGGSQRTERLRRQEKVASPHHCFISTCSFHDLFYTHIWTRYSAVLYCFRNCTDMYDANYVLFFVIQYNQYRLGSTSLPVMERGVVN